MAALPSQKPYRPMCYQCGVQMNAIGSGHVCPSCGTTSGFSDKEPEEEQAKE